VLFDGIEPNDVAQGKIANCWLMAAVSAVAEFSDFVRNSLFSSHPENSVSADCKYTIQLYDFKQKKMTPITVDDYIPVDEHDWLYNPQPLFAQSNGNEIYINIIEKAFAKYAGSYSNLIKGSIVKALIIMSGCEENIIWSIKTKQSRADC